MKKLFLLTIILVSFSNLAFAALTTADGVLTLDFFEENQSNIDNLWIMQFTFNDINPYILGAMLAISYESNKLTFENTLNESLNYFEVSKEFPTNDFNDYIQIINAKTFLTPGNSCYIYGIPNSLYYQTEGVELRPVLGTIDICFNGEQFQLTGPVDFVPVPEPISIVLFFFGACVLKFFSKRS